MKITLMGNGNFSQLIAMLAWIEWLGDVGHSASFEVFVDGDGKTRWGFKFDNEEQQKLFCDVKRELSKHYQGKDIELFEL